MTDERLQELKELGLWVVNDTVPGVVLTPESMQRISEACRALRPLALEVERLRGLVEEAYYEGARQESDCGCDACVSDWTRGWQQSDTRKALDGAA